MIMMLHTPNRYLRLFALAEDRARFARPVPVTPVYCELLTRLVFVRDERGLTFPVDPANLREPK